LLLLLQGGARLPFAAVSTGAAGPAPVNREKGQIQQRRGANGQGEGKENILEQAKLQYQKFYDRVYYGDVLPPVGPFQISYAR
jgi:hypothetical protein